MEQGNPSEVIPLMFRVITAIGGLPAREESVSWLPIDICAQAVIQLSGLATNAADPMVGSFDSKTQAGSFTSLIRPPLAGQAACFQLWLRRG